MIFDKLDEYISAIAFHLKAMFGRVDQLFNELMFFLN